MGSPLPVEGNIVRVNVGPSYEGGPEQLRPALVVRVWSETCVNAQVFFDGSNDRDCALAKTYRHDTLSYPLWLTSTTEGVGVGQWRW
jgi:hypothetical protein